MSVNTLTFLSRMTPDSELLIQTVCFAMEVLELDVLA